jgi:hypothetical protein
VDSEIADAKAHAYVVQSHLQRLQTVLSDIKEQLSVTQELREFRTFSDGFINGLIRDWKSPTKMYNTLQACNNAESEVEAIIAKCKDRLAKIEPERASTEKKLQELLEQA